MSKEPLFNIEEQAPLRLAGVLVAIHALIAFGPIGVATFIQSAGVLVPLNTPQASPVHHIISVLGSGFLHSSWTSVLVNGGMIVAFAVMTLRGVRALAKDQNKPARAGMIFIIIFFAGVVGGNLFQWGWWDIANSPIAVTLGASGGASALFATAAWAAGGRVRLMKFGAAWALINLIFVLGAALVGTTPWPTHIGGYIVGALLAPYLVKPFSTGFSITR